jgi:hypothetical protein
LDSIRRNTETITFRLDNDTLEKIRNVAKSENTSLNALVNRILESYIEWDLDAPNAGWALMPKLFLIELIRFHYCRIFYHFLRLTSNLQKHVKQISSAFKNT